MSTSYYEVQLKKAAEGDDIDRLYTVIQQDTFVLDRIDSKPFVETPLHVAAYAGHVHFAIEIMRLKPSYAYKLNQQGFSPIHLAMKRAWELNIHQQGLDHDQLAIQKRNMMIMVRRLVETDKEIVRVKGREGITPLHFATQIGQVDLLAAFLLVCPDSINDVTIRGETALHIAAKNNHYDALQILVGWLKRTTGPLNLEEKILNWADDEGNTVLHISAENNDSHQVVKLLVATKISLNLINWHNETALDRVDTTNADLKNILSHAGAKPRLQVNVAPIFTQTVRSNVTFLEKIFIFMLRQRRALSEEQRSSFLIVATLVATAIYQSSLSPPGGFYQDNNNARLNATTSETKIGKSVMPGDDFLFLSVINTLSILLSIAAIHILTPISRLEGFLLLLPLFFFATSYLKNLKFISPTSATSTFNLYTLNGFVYGLLFYVCVLYSWYHYRGIVNKRRRVWF